MINLGNIYFHGNRKNNKIALTFDDGPCNKTLKILQILKKEKVPATFFVLGKKIKGNEKILKQIINQRSEIGNHSYNHAPLRFKNKKLIENEIIKTEEELLKIGINPALFRPPYCSFGLNLLKICKKLNKKIILFDVHSKDWKLLKKQKIIKIVLNKTKNGSIINFHDYLEEIGENNQIIEIITTLIPILKKKYKFVTVSELLNY